MKQQSKKLVKAIGSVVILLDDLDTLFPVLEELGKRHVYYGVKPKHFKHLQKFWFKMLETALGLKWTEELKQAWESAWKLMTSVMKKSLADGLLLYTPPEAQYIKCKILINHIDMIDVQNLCFFADVWYAGYTGNNPSQSFAFNNEQKPKEPSQLTWGINILNAMETKSDFKS